MKIKTWMYYTFSATCFTISGVMNYIDGNFTRSTFLIIFSATLFGLAFINYKKV